MTEFPTISEMALKTHLPYCTIYLCEVAFSSLMIIIQNIDQLYETSKMFYIL